MSNEKKVIGCFAYIGRIEALCVEVDACLIGDNEEKMKEYIEEMKMDEKRKKEFQIKKTRYGEIKKGIELGAAYAFDEGAYSRFYPIAKSEGMDIKEWNKEEALKEGKKYLTLRVMKK